MSRNKQTKINDEFHVSPPTTTFFALPVYYLSEVFMACLESFWSEYRLNPPFMPLRSFDVSFSSDISFFLRDFQSAI